MPLTVNELNRIVLLICPACRAGQPRRYRPETREYVHDIEGKTPGGYSFYQHTVCWCSGLLASDLARELVHDLDP